MSTTSDKKLSVVFCCLGNICRSTMAEGAFRHIVHALHQSARFATIDSCGTSSYNIGNAPDSRTMHTLQLNGVQLEHKARQVCGEDFRRFDYILAMDKDNLRDLENIKPTDATAKVMLFGHFSDSRNEIVEDPYYGGQSGFTQNFEQVTRMSKRFLKEVLDVDAE